MVKVRVSAPARIHMGILNPVRWREEEGRLYASVGLCIEEPRTVVEVEPADELDVIGHSVGESTSFARKILNHYRLKGAKVNVLALPPRHAGLGSTTQLSLSIATCITRAYGLNVQPVELAMVLGRGKQSAIGTYAFQHGGFIVEGGWGDGIFPPLLFKYDFPVDWSVLIFVPEYRSIDEREEERIFEKLAAPPETLVYEACYRVLLGMAPAVLEKNIRVFGANLTRLQEVVGAIFSDAQGGVFQSHSAPLIERMREMGAIGLGQSSWGPAVYAFFGPERRDAIERILRNELIYGETLKEAGGTIYGVSEWGEVYFTHADNSGAVIG